MQATYNSIRIPPEIHTRHLQIAATLRSDGYGVHRYERVNDGRSWLVIEPEQPRFLSCAARRGAIDDSKGSGRS